VSTDDDDIIRAAVHAQIDRMAEFQRKAYGLLDDAAHAVADEQRQARVSHRDTPHEVSQTAAPSMRMVPVRVVTTELRTTPIADEQRAVGGRECVMCGHRHGCAVCLGPLDNGSTIARCGCTHIADIAGMPVLRQRPDGVAVPTGEVVTPATMLGEALGHLGRARLIIRNAAGEDRSGKGIMAREMIADVEGVVLYFKRIAEGLPVDERDVEPVISPATDTRAKCRINWTYEDADAEYVVQQVRRYTLPPASIVTTCDRMIRLLMADDETQAKRNACWQCNAPLGTTEGCMTCEAKRREAKP
jgi:hypothetical protein